MTDHNEQQMIERLEALSCLELPAAEAECDRRDIRRRLEEMEPNVREGDRSRWRTIMNNNLTRIAAMILLVCGGIGIVALMNQGSQLAFADVIRPILEARNGIFKIKVDDSPVIEDRVMGNRIHRTLETMSHGASIIDLETGKILSLDHRDQKAVLLDLEGLPDAAKSSLESGSYLEGLRDLIQNLQNSPRFAVNRLGRETIDGQELIGFRAEHPKVTLTIWADPETAVPVRIEQVEPHINVVCYDIQFDVEMDESLFSMEPPAGYSVQESSLDLKGGTEAAFVEFLRAMATVNQGTLPQDVSIEYLITQSANLDKQIKALNLSDDEMLELGMKIQQGIMFIRFYKGASPWHYAGSGVSLNQADTPIFWYQPEDSETFRVIYADLSVEDVASEDLPQ